MRAALVFLGIALGGVAEHTADTQGLAKSALSEKSADTGKLSTSNAEESTDTETLDVSDAELKEIYDEVDKNSDGVVTSDELWKATEEEFDLGSEKFSAEDFTKEKEELKKHLSESDSDKDGKITQAELKAFLQNSHGILEELAEKFGDDDEDDEDGYDSEERHAKGSLAEQGSHSEDEKAKAEISQSELAQIYDEADKNKDGVVTRDELWSSTQENFALDDDSEPDEAALKSKATLEKNLADADQDKDGKITRDELHSFIEKSRKILEVLAEADEEGDEEGDDDEEDDDENEAPGKLDSIDSKDKEVQA